MNERIRELAKQAGINSVVPVKGSLEYVSNGEVESLKKFAELIVRECADIAFTQANHYAETQNKGSAMSAADCVGRLIKIEFGVE